MTSEGHSSRAMVSTTAKVTACRNGPQEELGGFFSYGRMFCVPVSRLCCVCSKQ